MQPSPGQVAEAGGAHAAAGFFIPDLCQPRPVFFMVLLGELMVLVYTLSTSGLPEFNWESFAISSLFVQWVLLLSAPVLCLLRKIVSALPLALVSLCCFAVVLSITALTSLGSSLLLPGFFDDAPGHWWLLRNLLIAAVLTGVMLRYFYLQHQLLIQRQLELQSRLDSLRARIHPHFLFNTLNSIASLIVSRPLDAERAVEDLSELLRVNLQDNKRPVSVADELRLCELYLAIEQLRLGDKLRVEWDIDAGVRDKPMPTLVLQPLVENAVYHGVSQLVGGGTIGIAAHLRAGGVQVVVSNPVPAAATRSDGHHMALDNIRQRLQAMYGNRGQLRVEQGGGMFRVELAYPLGELA
jgi:two-component system sensor histidine kinase AlgZ